jgi:DNA-binding NarL/FixJ family response regulator
MQSAVMLVERSALVRSGLRRILEDEPDITVVAEASNAGAAGAALSHTDVDVVVVSTAADREAIRTSAIAALRLAANIKII